MPASKADTTLIIGQSGTGKTFGASLLANRASKPVVVLNSPAGAYRELIEPSISVRGGDWETPWSGGKTYVIEDIHSLSERQLRACRQLLNYTSRHQDCCVLMLSHAVNKNGIFSLISFFSNILFTNTLSNLRALRCALKNLYFPEAERIVEKFSSMRDHQYLRLTPSQHKVDVLNSNLEPLSSSGFDSSEIMVYFRHMPNQAHYQSIITFLHKNLDTNYIRSSDLSISAVSKGGKKVKVSYIDYIHALLDPRCRPSPEILQLHKLLSKSIVFPNLLVANPYMRK